MLSLRYFDYYGQYTVGVLMVLSVPILIFYGFLAGLFIIGCWQLFSASANTYAFLLYGLQKEIAKYWICTGLVMGCLFLSFPLSLFFSADDMQVIACVAVIAAVPVAVYYLSIYRKLIRQMFVRREISGLIKSKNRL